MKLSPRMMAALAILDVLASAEGPKRIEDLGKLCGFRFKKTEQVVNLLRRGGVVESVRGAGCKLARPAESILLCEVFRAVDGEVFCVPETETGPGAQRGPCVQDRVGRQIATP